VGGRSSPTEDGERSVAGTPACPRLAAGTAFAVAGVARAPLVVFFFGFFVAAAFVAFAVARAAVFAFVLFGFFVAAVFFVTADFLTNVAGFAPRAFAFGFFAVAPVFRRVAAAIAPR
jgi:hypothetical protein